MATQTPPQTLGLGSTGSDVSELQQNLKYHHVYKGPIDGVYGPQTQAAVKQFQGMSGISQDGKYGPQTDATLQNWLENPIKFTAADPIIQQRMAQNPQFAQTVNTAVANGGNQAGMLAAAHALAQGGTTGFTDANGNFNGNYFQSEALNQLSPQINQMLKYYNSDFANTLQHEKTQYQNQIGQNAINFNQQQNNMATQFGQQGDWLGGAAQLARNQAVATNQNTIGNIQNNAQYSLAGTARQFENQLGTGAINNYNTNLGQNASTSWNGGVNKSGSFNGYTPLGGQGGTLLAQYANNVNTQANNLATGSLPQVPKVNQYLAGATTGGSPNNFVYSGNY